MSSTVSNIQVNLSFEYISVIIHLEIEKLIARHRYRKKKKERHTHTCIFLYNNKEYKRMEAILSEESYDFIQSLSSHRVDSSSFSDSD
jgi:hypothetical protein